MPGQGAEQRLGRRANFHLQPKSTETVASPQRTGGEQQAAQRRSQPPLNPSHTMLTVEELEGMDDISGSALFSAEVKRLSHATREEQQPLIDAARKGDKNARDALVINCLNWIMTRAARINAFEEPEHLDLMDLVGVGYVEIMEKVDRSLEEDDPVVYLLSSAAYEMQSHAGFMDDLITRPRASSEALKRRDPMPVRTVSLEKSLQNGRTYVDTLPAQEYVVAETGEKFAIVYEAVEQLTPSCRRTIIDSFGLYGHPAKTKQEIAKDSNLKYAGVRDSHLRARKQLNEKLAPHLHRLIRR